MTMLGPMAISKISPLAPPLVTDAPAVPGVKLATAAAGIRYADRTDVLLVVLDRKTTMAGVFTQSKCPSAPVEWCRAKLKRGQARALVVNSGNANAFTGKTGKQSTALTAQQPFPDLFTDMMAVGEQTGHFAQTMQTIADVYERELDRTVKTISALIPPVIIVLIAVVVGFVVYSILSAVFEMTHSLQVRPS